MLPFWLKDCQSLGLLPFDSFLKGHPTVVVLSLPYVLFLTELSSLYHGAAAPSKLAVIITGLAAEVPVSSQLDQTVVLRAAWQCADWQGGLGARHCVAASSPG